MGDNSYMSKLKFEPKDFSIFRDPKVFISEAAKIANARLAEMIEACQVVYGKYEQGDFYSQKRPFPLATHKARLVNVEELPKPECAHEPDYRRILEAGDRRCVKCKVELKATWEAVK